MSERNGSLPYDVFAGSELHRQTNGIANAASIRPAELRPVGGKTRAGCDRNDKNPEKHLFTLTRRRHLRYNNRHLGGGSSMPVRYVFFVVAILACGSLQASPSNA